MNIEIYNALIELVKQGGILALWGISIWLVLGIVRVAMVCWVVYLVVKVVCNTITTAYRTKLEVNGQRVHLLSEEISKQFTTTLDTFLKDTETLLQSLETRLRELDKESNKK